MADILRVYCDKDLVGDLRMNEKRDFIFQYAKDWLKNPISFPLSIRLPLQEEEFQNEKCRMFFTNLLPEGEVRTSVARKLGLSETNDFMLLRAIGGECAGAISLLPEEHEVSFDEGYLPISPDELDNMIDQMTQTPLLIFRPGQRLSLAGAQQKLPIYINEGKIYSPKGTSPSSHILKPGIRGYKDIVENEIFCMRLARKYNLPVPDVNVIKGKRYPVYVVQRYDRTKNEQGKLARIHQEDFCQALGFSYSQKYEVEGGPTLKMCLSLISDHGTQPLIDKWSLLQWVAFNFLIGNRDAHAKNISMLITKREYRLAPFYDLISTRIYPNLSDKKAMKIGGEDRPEWVLKRHWEHLAEDAGANFRAVNDICNEMCKKLPSLSKQLAEELSREIGPSDVFMKIAGDIGASADRLLWSLNSKAEA